MNNFYIEALEIFLIYMPVAMLIVVAREKLIGIYLRRFDDFDCYTKNQ